MITRADNVLTVWGEGQGLGVMPALIGFWEGYAPQLGTGRGHEPGAEQHGEYCRAHDGLRSRGTIRSVPSKASFAQGRGSFHGDLMAPRLHVPRGILGVCPQLTDRIKRDFPLGEVRGRRLGL